MPTTRRHATRRCAVAVAFGAAYTVLSLVRFDRFTLSSWDNAIFEQAVRGYAHLGAPTIDVKGAGLQPAR